MWLFHRGAPPVPNDVTRIVHETAATPASAPAIAPAAPVPGVVSPRLPPNPVLKKVSSDAEEKAFADSFRVSLTDASKFDVIASSFQGAPGVGKVQDQKQLLDKFFTFMNVVSWSAIALAVLMVLCATLLMATTIRQTAFSRRRETGIMRLVGASNSTIQLPFIMETVIAAVVGAGLAMTLLYATVRYGVSGYLSTALIDTAFIGVPDVVAIAPWVIGGVVALAVLTSGFTLRRYLRV